MEEETRMGNCWRGRGRRCGAYRRGRIRDEGGSGRRKCCASVRAAACGLGMGAWVLLGASLKGRGGHRPWVSTAWVGPRRCEMKKCRGGREAHAQCVSVLFPEVAAGREAC